MLKKTSGLTSLFRLTVAVFSASFFPSCSGKEVDLSWAEEVQIGSSEVVLLNRTAHAKELRELGGTSSWSGTNMTLEIVLPKNAAAAPKWDFPLVPILVDRVPGSQDWLVVATFYDCISWYNLGRPKTPYVEFKTHEGTWQKIPLEESLVGRSANLLTGIRSSGESHLVTVREKADRDRRAAEKYRHVIANWETTC
jgi:hypothetical protein